MHELFPDWKWVPSKLNVADIATKIQHNPDIYSTWFNGPEYLYKNELDWPLSMDLGDINKSEVSSRFLHMRKDLKFDIRYEYFSSWFSLYRSVSIWLLYIDLLYKRVNKIHNLSKLNVQHIISAKNTIYKEIQKANLTDEWIAIKSNEHIASSSKLAKLNIWTTMK